MMKTVLATLILMGLLPNFVFAATKFEVSGWIPYWKAAAGSESARKNIRQLAEINPFGYSVKSDGTLFDLADIKHQEWQRLFKVARAKKVRVVPTVMWSDGGQMQAVLSDPKQRAAHVKAVATMVKRGRYDGVDIDYEGKRAETNPHFSQFLRELKQALGAKKILSCTIEPRTPPDSLYRVIPATLEYSNDYEVIGEVCDRVKVMAYDQRSADWKLNTVKGAAPYLPVADLDWVRKVAALAEESIPKSKLVLGVPTYGQEYELSGTATGGLNYRRLWALNPSYALETAAKHGLAAVRNWAGELSFTYPNGKPNSLNFITWSDAGAIRQKAALARELGWRGLAIFKIDGGEDPALWDLF